MITTAWKITQHAKIKKVLESCNYSVFQCTLYKVVSLKKGLNFICLLLMKIILKTKKNCHICRRKCTLCITTLNLKPFYGNSVYPDQLASFEASWSGSTLFFIHTMNQYEWCKLLHLTGLQSEVDIIFTTERTQCIIIIIGFWLKCRCRSIFHMSGALYK